MKRLGAIMLAGVIAMGAATPFQSAADEPLTQGQLAILLVRALELEVTLPLTEEKAIQLLTAQGISPLGGWDPSALATRMDLFVLIAKALRLEVENPEDPASYEAAVFQRFPELAGGDSPGAPPFRRFGSEQIGDQPPEHLSRGEALFYLNLFTTPRLGDITPT
jgi:hypothetical protein